MIDLRQSDGIAHFTMTYGKANTLDIGFCEALIGRFQAARRADVRAVILTGQGRMFSAGVDLVRLAEGGTDYIRRFLPVLHRLYDTVFNFPKPVVAAINGHAIAGGCVLAACADYRVMGRDAGRMGITELQVGVPFPALAFEIMRYVTAPQYFSDVVLSAATYECEAARERGLIDVIAPPLDLSVQAEAAARRLAALPRETFALTKRQLHQPVAERMARDGARIEAEVTEIWTRAETVSHVRAFVAQTLKKS